jgi:hypothetical protein
MLLDYSLVVTLTFNQKLVFIVKLRHVIGIQRVTILVLLSCDCAGRNDCSTRHVVVDSNMFPWSNGRLRPVL